MQLLGVMDEPAAKAVPLLREVMEALTDASFVKSHWNGDAIKTTAGILANFCCAATRALRCRRCLRC